MVSRIRRWVETDTGHRVPNHKSNCCNLHGHRYRWEAELEGEIITTPGISEQGMVIDFSDVSSILKDRIHDVVDHAFIVYCEDELALRALKEMGDNHRTHIVSFIPTAENLAKWAFEQISPAISSRYGNSLRLYAFHVRETPKSWASWYSKD